MAIDIELFQAQAAALLTGERDPVANAANVSALIYQTLPDLNWAGFYFVRGDQLVLGPFQGKPACVRIERGAGVCGTAWVRAQTIVVPDVHTYPGHIACDAASNSEIVIPLVRARNVVGVLDLDSPLHNRFDDTDQRMLEALARTYLDASDL